MMNMMRIPHYSLPPFRYKVYHSFRLKVYQDSGNTLPDIPKESLPGISRENFTTMECKMGKTP
jgi:hypothetical protein